MPYTPVVIAHRMSDYGYWVVDVSVSPSQTLSVMIAQTGISPDRARELAVAGLPVIPRSIPPW